MSTLALVIYLYSFGVSIFTDLIFSAQTVNP